MVGGWWVVGVQGKNHNSSCSYEQAEPSRARAELVNSSMKINEPLDVAERNSVQVLKLYVYLFKI